MLNDDLLLDQLVLLLAGSGMSDEQLLRLLRQLRTAPYSLILEKIHLHRGAVAPRLGRSAPLTGPMSNHPPRAVFIDDEAIRNVERLLVLEAGLPKLVAARAITMALKERHPNKEFPSFNSKEGFSKWLAAISEQVQLGELLHIAASLRNELVHGDPKDDWIKGKK